MPPIDQIKYLSDLGFGMGSFFALLYGGFKVLKWLEEVKTTHLHHIQKSLDRLTDNSNDANDMLRTQARSMDAQAQMLGMIVSQTKKDV